jgi:hypothetical protein
MATFSISRAGCVFARSRRSDWRGVISKTTVKTAKIHSVQSACQSGSLRNVQVQRNQASAGSGKVRKDFHESPALNPSSVPPSTAPTWPLQQPINRVDGGRSKKAPSPTSHMAHWTSMRLPMSENPHFPSSHSSGLRRAPSRNGPRYP